MATFIAILSLLVAGVSAIFSWRSSRAARKSLVAGNLINALGDMFTALERLSDAAVNLRSNEQLAHSRSTLEPHFQEFKTASMRVELLEVAITNDELGGWIRTLLNNFAADLLQADEFAFIEADELIHDNEPNPAAFRASSSFRSVTMTDRGFPAPKESGIESLTKWWLDRIEFEPDYPSVYAVDAPYMTQHARVLDDFVREYAIPWAQRLVEDRLR